MKWRENVQSPEDSRPVEPAAAKLKRRRVAAKGAPPLQGDTLGALGAERAPRTRKAKDKVTPKPETTPTKQRTEPLNFRVAPDFRRAFKRAAATEDCKKVELLERIFAEWSSRNPA